MPEGVDESREGQEGEIGRQIEADAKVGRDVFRPRRVLP
jgi:hypothetical protein